MFTIDSDERRQFTRGYVRASSWANVVHDDGADDDLAADALPADLVAELAEDVSAFLALEHSARYLRAAFAAGQSFDELGWDFALTRNGHGTGYWDRGLGSVGTALSELARSCGERHICVDGAGSFSLL